MKTSQSEIKRALADVRRAFRLLHDYQRSVLDAVGYIQRELDLHHADSGQYFSEDSPGELNCWAWDWLPMMFYDFTFNTKRGVSALASMTVWLFSDTGYFDSSDSFPEKTNVQTFAAAERSRTMVGFLFYREWKSEYNLFADNRPAIREFLNTGRLSDELAQGGVVGMIADFSRLTNVESADELVDELAEFAQTHGFAIERVKKSR